MYKEVSVKRLNVGMYVNLGEIPWLKHPFLISRFRITKTSEIRTLVALGCKTILYDPRKSTSAPLKEEVEIEKKELDYHDVSAFKSTKASELRKRRKRFQQIERQFHDSLEQTETIMRGIMSGEVTFFDEAKALSREMALKFVDDVSLSVQHINATAADDGQQFHSLNVMVLALTLGKQVGLSPEEMDDLSFGALMHDIGQNLLPKTVRIKPKLTKPELKQFREHPKLGVSILSKLPDINKQVMKVVYQHHEECSGKGYPLGIDGETITPLTKIVSIADIYDRIINTRNPALALSPHTALAYLYGKKRDCFDQDYLGMFIKMLGIYPPGTTCRFSSGDVGTIVGFDPDDPLHPEVILFDPAIPKHDAIIYKLGVDLDVQIKETINSHELEPEAFNYLNSRSIIQYFPASI